MASRRQQELALRRLSLQRQLALRGQLALRAQPNNYGMNEMSLMYIKRGLVDAFWTAAIVFAVRLIPLVFYGLRLIFHSVTPLAGMALYQNRRGLFNNRRDLFNQRRLNRRLGLFALNRRGRPQLDANFELFDNEQEFGDRDFEQELTDPIFDENDDVQSDADMDEGTGSIDRIDEIDRNDDEFINENNEDLGENDEQDSFNGT